MYILKNLFKHLLIRPFGIMVFHFKRWMVLKQSYRNALVHVGTCISWTLKYCGGGFNFQWNSASNIA